MPGREQRREIDLRSGRFESEMRVSDLTRRKLNEGGTHIEGKVYVCSRCMRPFEERSRHCPRCDTKTMCELRPNAESERARYRERSIREIRAKHGFKAT